MEEGKSGNKKVQVLQSAVVDLLVNVDDYDSRCRVNVKR